MIGAVAIDSQALTRNDGDARAFRIQNQRLSSFLSMYATLTVLGEQDARELIGALRAQADDLGYDFWGSLLRAIELGGTGVHRIRPQLPKSTREYGETGLPVELTKLVDLLVIGEPTIADSWGLTEAQDRTIKEYGFTRVDATLELTVPASIDQCSTAMDLEALRNEVTKPAGASREKTWSQIFRPLVGVSTEVNIFDRYMFSGLLELNVSGRRKKRGIDHLIWILNRLDEELPKTAEVNLFALVGEPVARDNRDPTAKAYEVGDIAAALGRLEAWNRPGALHLYLATFLDHERHMRFNNAAVKLTAGLDRFAADHNGLLRRPLEYAYVGPGESLDSRVKFEGAARDTAQHWVLRSKKGGFEQAP